MIGPQTTAVKTALGPLLNGLVNYEYWLPVPSMMFPGVGELMETYQSLAPAEDADLVGSYMAPQGYAQMQVIEQAITATGGLDDTALAEHTRTAGFDTVVGTVRFGDGGEWEQPRVVQVQYQNVTDAGPEQFKTAHTQVVVTPTEYASGELELEKWSRPVDRISRRSRGGFLILLVGALDHHPLVERGAGPDEGDEVGSVDRPPPLLGRLDELAGHGQSGCP